LVKRGFLKICGNWKENYFPGKVRIRGVFKGRINSDFFRRKDFLKPRASGETTRVYWEPGFIWGHLKVEGQYSYCGDNFPPGFVFWDLPF